jgi:RHS repeat-associated protein
VVFSANQRIDPACDYTYDALYRLIEATGRENAPQSAFRFVPPDGNYRDYPFVGAAQQNDLQALRRYSEQYEYDGVGNFHKMLHHATGGDWTRTYAYHQASQLESARRNNRLSETSLASGAVGSREPYSYDVHGNITQMAHLPLMQWNFLDQLSASSRQVVNAGAPEMTYYVYDAAGQRARKITERHNGRRKHERAYLAGVEVYREFDVDGIAELERETLHVMDDTQRIALVETKTMDARAVFVSGTPLQRYQLANHLGSASLELDAAGELISYEEYSPYGCTTYQAGRSSVAVSLKRYRYTGKERDEENGFTYHGARYCAPWLGRWVACDPKLLVSAHSSVWSGRTPYAYASGRPTSRIDPDGADDNNSEYYVSDLHNPPDGRFQAIVEDVKTHGLADTLKHRLANGAVTDAAARFWSKATDFSRFTEVGPARQGFLSSVSPVPLPFTRPTVDPETGATDYSGQKEWDKGEAVGVGLQLGDMFAGGITPPGSPGPALVPATGGAQGATPIVLAPPSVVLAPPALFAKQVAPKNETKEESDRRHEEEVKQFEESGGQISKLKEGSEIHHVASVEAEKTIRPGDSKSYSDLYREMFRSAGLGKDKRGNDLLDPLNDSLNLISLEGHEGPHGIDYLEAIYKDLSNAVAGLKAGTQEYREAFIKELMTLRSQVSKKGTFLNDRATNRK